MLACLLFALTKIAISRNVRRLEVEIDIDTEDDMSKRTDCVHHGFLYVKDSRICHEDQSEHHEADDKDVPSPSPHPESLSRASQVQTDRQSVRLNTGPSASSDRARYISASVHCFFIGGGFFGFFFQ